MLKRHRIKRTTFAEQAVAKTTIPASGFKLVTVTRNEPLDSCEIVSTPLAIEMGATQYVSTFLNAIDLLKMLHKYSLSLGVFSHLSLYQRMKSGNLPTLPRLMSSNQFVPKKARPAGITSSPVDFSTLTCGKSIRQVKSSRSPPSHKWKQIH